MMTLKVMKARHIALWDWLSKNPSKDKFQYPGFKSNGGKLKDPNNGCWACEWLVRQDLTDCMDEDGNSICSIDWAPSKKGCMNSKSAYYKWGHAKHHKVRSRWAKVVRDLPLLRNSNEKI